jgi:hypothetical protein
MPLNCATFISSSVSILSGEPVRARRARDISAVRVYLREASFLHLHFRVLI